MACFSVWDIQNCGCTSPGQTCSPCVIPYSSGTLSYTNTLFGNGSVVLTWNGSSGSLARWNAATINFGGGSTYTFHLLCFGGATTLSVNDQFGDDCPDITAACWQVIDYTCSPYHIHFQIINPLPSLCSGFCATPGSAGFTDLYVDI